MRPYYDDGTVTIYHGDSREIVPSLTFDAVVTDPPYGIDYQPDGSMPKSRVYDAVVGDAELFDPAWLLDLGCPLIAWGANHYASRLPDAKGWLVWRKIAFYVADLEFAWTNCVAKPSFIEVEWRGATRGVERGDHFHPTQKPLAVMRWCLEKLPDGTGTVLDPYMGSGTTLRAAKDLGSRDRDRGRGALLRDRRSTHEPRGSRLRRGRVIVPLDERVRCAQPNLPAAHTPARSFRHRTLGDPA